VWQAEAGRVTAKPDHLTFDISGMTCASCSARVEKVLSRQPGVREARVNLALERADIEGDDLDPGALAVAIGKAGYGALLRRQIFQPAVKPMKPRPRTPGR
jgi:Cu+-exporting ATPase